MKFDLQITCDNAAFCPVHDDASEPERAASASAEVARILAKLDIPYSVQLVNERGAAIRDTNGNTVGAWSLGEDDESTGETLDEMLARHARELAEAFPDRIPPATITARLDMASERPAFTAPQGQTHAETATDEAPAETGFAMACRAIREGRAEARALWLLLKDEHERDGYALRPNPWEGSGEYQHLQFTDGRSVLVKLPDLRRLPKKPTP